MPERAHVVSVEALESFRASLIVYISQARATLEEVTADVVRARNWVEHDQRAHWEKEVRRLERALDEAQQALFSARLSLLSKETSVEQLLLSRAKRARDEAEAKRRVVKGWTRNFDNRVQPLVKQMEKLHSVLSFDMVRAIAYLADTIRILSSYAEMAAPPGQPKENIVPAEARGVGGNAEAGGAKP
jgi:nucleoside phosphorylase